MQDDIHFPTQAEIEAHILNARKLRAETFAGWLKAAVHWLTHPHFAPRHA